MLRSDLPIWIGWMLLGSMVLLFVLTLIYRDMVPLLFLPGNPRRRNSARRVNRFRSAGLGDLMTRAIPTKRMLADRQVCRDAAPRGGESLRVSDTRRAGLRCRREPSRTRLVSLLTGARTEELRVLEWDRVDLDGDPPTFDLWRSVRAGGDTKTKRSRRTMELPARFVDVLRDHRLAQRLARPG